MIDGSLCSKNATRAQYHEAIIDLEHASCVHRNSDESVVSRSPNVLPLFQLCSLRCGMLGDKCVVDEYTKLY